MKWLIFTAQMPATPSSLRVMVWRRMRAAGAIGLQNGVWVLPNTDIQRQFLGELQEYLETQGASAQVFAASALIESVEENLLDRFRAQRAEEYAELIERCNGMLAELAKESRKGKFTFAELEENEDDLEKLADWLAKIQARDHIGGAHTQEAIARIAACRIALEAFAGQVYLHEGLDPQDDSDASAPQQP